MKKTRLIVTSLLFAAACSITSFAGTWQKNDTGYWWQNDDGSYPANTWQWIDGNQDGTAECYYFDGNGYMLSDTTTPDGYLVNADGAWMIDGVIQLQTQNASVPADTAADPALANNQSAQTNSQNKTSSNQSAQTGSQSKKSSSQGSQTGTQNAQASSSVISSVPYDGYTIIVNTNTMKFHKTTCRAVGQMAPEHFGYASDRSALIAMGYTTCGWCHR